MGSNRAPSSCPFVWPVLEDTSSPQAFTKGPRQLFGLSLLEKEGATTFRLPRGLHYFGGPGPEPVCRAHLADSTTANKIQGPELQCPALLTPLMRVPERDQIRSSPRLERFL